MRQNDPAPRSRSSLTAKEQTKGPRFETDAYERPPFSQESFQVLATNFTNFTKPITEPSVPKISFDGLNGVKAPPVPQLEVSFEIPCGPDSRTVASPHCLED